ncbi:transmembrane amino acid transporter [Nitzschia inconspicua]|uniref:Transmembrane amino acid transporter n=1 Tax=Nitzschia inconspicua TaxID=303405 RepID=A0A9K3KC61_9STRA|nr:transmembrane amino acid transporter [Nitzschia inconspicua]KAG7340456.1 transmembrane amino acid transporter [Nitzschia inconspicua]
MYSVSQTPFEDKDMMLNRKDAGNDRTISKSTITNKSNKRDKFIGNSKTTAVTFNLIKAIAGSGVLALPSGIAAMSDYGSSLFPAIALMTVLGGISAYTFAMYGRLVHVSQAKSLGELWEKKKNKRSAWFVSFASFLFCFGACLSYSILLGDVSSSMAQTLGGSGILTSRHFWIMLLTTFVLYPLCNLPSLLALAPLSRAGVAAVLMTTMFIVFRCPFVNPGSPYAAVGGTLMKTLSAIQLPRFNTFNNGFCHPSSLILLGMAASAYLGHFTAPNFYHSVKRAECAVPSTSDDGGIDCITAAPEVDPSFQLKADENSVVLKDFFKVTIGGFSAVTIINCFIMAFGFLTFGGNSSGVILNNYSTFDSGATVCRFLTAISVIGGYPFLMSACRSEFLVLWNLRSGRTTASQMMEKRTTFFMLLMLTLGSMLISNAGFVIGLIGAILGSAIVYIFPSLLYLAYTGKMVETKRTRIRVERMFCRLLILFGIVAAFAGGSVSILSNCFPHLLI